MITGDHSGTAVAIGRQIDLRNSDMGLTGHNLDTMDDAALRAAVLDTDKTSYLKCTGQIAVDPYHVSKLM